MLRACAAAANAPAWAERMAVRPRPRMEMATSTSSSVNPRRVISKPRVRALGGLAVVPRARHAHAALLDVGLAGERRDHDAHRVRVARGAADAELDAGALRLPSRPEVEVGLIGLDGVVLVARLDLQ